TAKQSIQGDRRSSYRLGIGIFIFSSPNRFKKQSFVDAVLFVYGNSVFLGKTFRINRDIQGLGSGYYFLLKNELRLKFFPCNKITHPGRTILKHIQNGKTLLAGAKESIHTSGSIGFLGTSARDYLFKAILFYILKVVIVT